jgi:HD-like signal output (HDOD) protein
MEKQIFRMRMHAYATAHVAAWLSETPVGQPFVAGLVHDLGRMLIHRSAVRLRKGPDPDPAYVDRVLVQLHAAVGAIMAYQWNLDPAFIAATAFHNHPSRAPAAHQHLTWVIHASDIIARTAGAEWDGLESNGREVLGSVHGIQFDMEAAIDQAHDAFNHFETIEAGIDAHLAETGA